MYYPGEEIIWHFHNRQSQATLRGVEPQVRQIMIEKEKLKSFLAGKDLKNIILGDVLKR